MLLLVGWEDRMSEGAGACKGVKSLNKKFISLLVSVSKATGLIVEEILIEGDLGVFSSLGKENGYKLDAKSWHLRGLGRATLSQQEGLRPLRGCSQCQTWIFGSCACQLC